MFIGFSLHIKILMFLPVFDQNLTKNSISADPKKLFEVKKLAEKIKIQILQQS